MGFLLGIAIFVGLLFYSCFAWGFVVSKFYVWFIIPLFPDVPDISVAGFIGIMLFLFALLPKHVNSIRDEYKNVGMEWGGSLLGPWLSLFCGWLIHLWV